MQHRPTENTNNPAPRMCKTNNSNTTQSNSIPPSNDRGEPLDNRATVITSQETTKNDTVTQAQAIVGANVVDTDDIDAANTLLSLHYGGSSADQDPTTGCSSAQPTSQAHLMGIDGLRASSSREVSNSGNVQVQTYTCPICRGNFPSEIVVLSHIPCMNQPSAKFVCELCPANFNDESRLKNHLDAIHGAEQCQICGARFKYKRTLSVHRNSKHPAYYKTCEICNTRLSSRRNLNSHKRRAHAGNPKLTCDVCKVKFNEIHSLIFHRNQQHEEEVISGDIGKKYNRNKLYPNIEHSCALCNFSSRYKPSLKRHYSTMHSGGAFDPNAEHQCTQCNFSSRYKFCLKRHYSTMHFCRAPESEPKPKSESESVSKKLNPQSGDPCPCKYRCGFTANRYDALVCHERVCGKTQRRK